MPSRATARVGLVSAASLSLALMVVTPALAVVGGVPEVNDPCTVDVAPPPGFICTPENKLALAPPAAPAPAPADPTPAPAGPPAAVDPAQAAPPADATPAPGVPTPDPAAPVAVVPTDPASSAPAGPAAPAGPTTPTGTSGAPASGTSGRKPTPVTVVTPPGTTLRASAAGVGGAPTSLLAAATVANLASTDLPTLAAMRSLPLLPGHAGLPLSAYTPSPQLADIPLATLPPSTRIAVVQAPLLAAGEDAAGGGGFTLADLSGRALPGLLVVLATALVASIGAANIRVWQDKLATARS